MTVYVVIQYYRYEYTELDEVFSSYDSAVKYVTSQGADVNNPVVSEETPIKIEFPAPAHNYIIQEKQVRDSHE